MNVSNKREDLYAILGIPSDASEGAVKCAYRKKALATHSDHNHSPEADDAFCRVQRAWQILRDPRQRAAYDQRDEIPVWIEIEKSAMVYDPSENDWRYDCLCGGAFYADDGDLKLPILTVGCDSCSKHAVF